MLWRASGLSSLEDYLDSSLGIQKSLFPTVLGLKLAEDLDLGRRFEPWDHTNINIPIPHDFPNAQLLFSFQSPGCFLNLGLLSWFLPPLSIIIYICRQDCFTYCLFPLPPFLRVCCLSLANHPVHSPTCTRLSNCRTTYLLAYPLPFLLRVASFLYVDLFPFWSKVVFYMLFFWNWTENQKSLILFSDILTIKESRRIEDRMTWVKTEPERSPISFSKSALFSDFTWHYNMF